MLCIVPSVGMALSSFAGVELRYASGLFNLMRNLGGAVGIATVTTWLNDNARIQALRFGEALSHIDASATETLRQLTDRALALSGDPAQAVQLAEGIVGRVVSQASLAVAFNDTFRTMSWMFVAALCMVPFCKSKGGAARAVAIE